MIKKILGLLILIVGALTLLYYIAWLFSPGSYAKAEIYNFDIPEEKLIKIIEEVKIENPGLVLKQMPRLETGEVMFLEEGRESPIDHWYNIYFYYTDKNQIIKTWTRPQTTTAASFAFVSVCDGLTLDNWQTVNDSFWWWKNAPLKEEFEERILKKIEEKVKTKNP